jgi:GntP family gluconate:H+ symporter
MLTGIWLIIGLLVAIAVMIVMISKFKIHPFISILLVSLILAVLSLPLADVPGTIAAGFGGTMQGIGIVIILGALIGFIVEKTGAALVIAESVVKVVGKKHPELSMMIMGWIVSIPVFCDSGFIILDPIRKSLRKMAQKSAVGMALALSLGLYASHVFMPPTPGPIAAAASVGLGDNLLLVMGVGVIISIFALVPSYFYSMYIGKKVQVADDIEDAINPNVTQETFEILKKKYGKLPNAFLSFSPIVVPIIALALGTFWKMLNVAFAAKFFAFLGAPIIALSLGVVFGVILLIKTKKINDFYSIVNDNLKIVGPILFITAAGGVLGRVISAAGVVQFVTSNADAFKILGIIFPFMIAAILKISQGSSTVAIVTTAAMMGLYTDPASLMTALGFTTSISAALVVMAIGAGSMTVSHANDSYFWVVTNMTGMTPEQGYKVQTLGTLISGLGSLVGILIMSIFFL